MRANAKGFTLIELLIVIVIIGILATIAIPRFFNTKERALVAAMKSDLRNLIVAEDAYFSDAQVYTSNLSLLTTMFRTSGNGVITIDSASSTGWGATATNPGTSVVCTAGASPIRTSPPSCSGP